MTVGDPGALKDKRRLMLTQLQRSPVLNPAGTEVGRVEDFIVKLADGAYPPVKGLKVRVGAQDVFIGKDQYMLGADGNLMPIKKDQPPPDLRHFNVKK